RSTDPGIVGRFRRTATTSSSSRSRAGSRRATSRSSATASAARTRASRPSIVRTASRKRLTDRCTSRTATREKSGESSTRNDELTHFGIWLLRHFNDPINAQITKCHNANIHGVDMRRAFTLAATLAAVCVVKAADRAEITFADARIFPESLTSTKNGDVYFGSLGQDAVYRATSNESQAKIWIQPKSNGLA